MNRLEDSEDTDQLFDNNDNASSITATVAEADCDSTTTHRNNSSSSNIGATKLPMDMPKSKSKPLCNRVTTGIRYYTRPILITLLVFPVLYLVISYFENNNTPNTTSTIALTARDRTETYNVKVLLESMSDSELNALPKESFSYLAMIDAGSSGCRAHVYRYGKLGNKDGPLYILPQHESRKVKPGLSSFAGNPGAAGSSLKGLVDFMREQVPENMWSVTPIWLKATAGLRMLPSEQADAVLNSVKDFLGDKNNSPFLFRRPFAKIIPGIEEGGFGWIAFNYLKKIIGPKKAPNAELPYAVIEMGGASSQVSQVAPTAAEANLIPEEYRFSFTIEGTVYHLYTHSYLGFGAEQAREQLNKLIVTSQKPSSTNPTNQAKLADPCLQNGYSRYSMSKRGSPYEGPDMYNVSGASTSTTCENLVSELFVDKVGCEKVKTPPYSFGCVYQPSFVAASENILIFENFYYLSSAIGVAPKDTSNSLDKQFPLVTTPKNILSATDKFCASSWSDANTKYPVDKQDKENNIKFCFVGSYSYSFLVDGLKINEEKLVTVQKDVGDSEIEWALGAAYKEAADFLKRKHLRPSE